MNKMFFRFDRISYWMSRYDLYSTLQTVQLRSPG